MKSEDYRHWLEAQKYQAGTITAQLHRAGRVEELNPHNSIARLRGSFASISHGVNEPLNAAIQTGVGNISASTPLALVQPRTAMAWQMSGKTVPPKYSDRPVIIEFD
jgi:hypothetical protein